MDDKIHVGVTIDGDASQELFRETGRYIFFKGDEVEPAMTAQRRAADPGRRRRQHVDERRRVRRRRW